MANLTVAQLKALDAKYGTVISDSPYKLEKPEGTLAKVTLETTNPETGERHKYPPVARVQIGDFSKWYPIHRKTSATKGGAIAEPCLGLFRTEKDWHNQDKSVFVPAGRAMLKVYSLAHQ